MRRYVDNIYTNSLEGLLKQRRENLLAAKQEMAARNIGTSGIAIQAEIKVYVKFREDMVEARAAAYLRSFGDLKRKLENRDVGLIVADLSSLASQTAQFHLPPGVPANLVPQIRGSMESEVRVRCHSAVQRIRRVLENQAALPEREAEAALPMVVANIVGDNARINMNSIDTSTNTVAIDLSQQFASMRDAFKSAIDDRQTLEAILDRVASLEKAANAKAPLIPPLNELLSVAANWVTVLTPFLPFLGTLVQH
jgi:hypothetical protein